MKESIDKKRYSKAENIIRIYTESEPDSKLDRQVKLWLISDFHKEEKEAILQHIWNILSVTDDSGKKKVWDTIQREIGVTLYKGALELAIPDTTLMMTFRDE